MDKKLLKIVIGEVVIGLIAFFWYKTSLPEEPVAWEGLGLPLIFIVVVATIVITLIVAFITKLLNRNNEALGLSSNRYGLKFWAVVILFVVIFIAMLPYELDWVDKIIFSIEKNNRSQNCIQVITPAKYLKSGEIRDFPTPCDVPEGWQKI